MMPFSGQFTPSLHSPFKRYTQQHRLHQRFCVPLSSMSISRAQDSHQLIPENYIWQWAIIIMLCLKFRLPPQKTGNRLKLVTSLWACNFVSRRCDTCQCSATAVRPRQSPRHLSITGQRLNYPYGISCSTSTATGNLDNSASVVSSESDPWLCIAAVLCPFS